MAAGTKFEVFVGDLANKVHDLLGSTVGTDIDDYRIYLSNTAPNAATMAVKADLAEIAAGNGYTAGGNSVTPVGARSGGTLTLSGTKVTWTATGGTIGPFQYIVLYNNTPLNDPLICFWNRGAALTLQDGESFSVRFSGSDTTGAILTIS